jgi:hypothetical protein
MANRWLVLSLVVVLGAPAALGGCSHREPAAVAPGGPTGTVAPAGNSRVVTYPEGRYELRGDGTAASPYVWVWIPAGAAPPNPPPPPRRP